MDSKPWTIGISIIALIVSVLSVIFSLKNQSIQIQTTVRDQLDSVVQDLVKTLADSFISLSQDRSNPSWYSTNAVLSMKLSSLSRHAKALIEQEPATVTDIEYSVVAQACSMANDLPQASIYWQKAVESSPSPYYKVVNLRSFADFQYRQGRYEEGRALYQQALGIMDNSNDFQKQTNAWTYQMWCVSETLNLPNQFNKSDEYYRDARAILETIANPAVKANCLKALEVARQTSVNSQIPQTPTIVPPVEATSPTPPD
jgi:tetratricopeptide (TPR) repeat protein